MTTVVRFRLRPGTEDEPHARVQVFVGHGTQKDPADITAGLAGELVMDRAEWDALRGRIEVETGRTPWHGVAFAEARR